MLARLVSNSRPHVIHLPRPPKVLRLQVRATVPSYKHMFYGDYVSVPQPGHKLKSLGNIFLNAYEGPTRPMILNLREVGPSHDNY